MPVTVISAVHKIILGLLILLLAGCRLPGVFSQKFEVEIDQLVSSQQTYSYTEDVQPILEQKCIACHACYDAPCQLKLTSAAGLLRGASDKGVYSSDRLHDADPTRLFMDGHSPAQWRQKGFFSVLNASGGTLDSNLENSVLAQMIAFGHENAVPANTPVPDNIKLGLARENECPAPDKFHKYKRKHPQQGMPLAITGLTDSEYQTLRQWIYEGSIIDKQPWIGSPEELEQIADWEQFLNRREPKNRLVARYLYEHLFPAHLYFDELETGNFFEIVRSTTPAGEPVNVIATVRPNDDPGGYFYYRLRKVEGTIVHKTHMPYPLGKAKMERIQELLLSSDWQVAAQPDYSMENAVNPFATFDAIPARGRYQFMLDTAQYFVTTFIRGPVCAGQIATDVIDDQFFLLFQNPDSDLSVTNENYRAVILPHLALVPQKEGVPEMIRNWGDRVKEMKNYNNLRGQHYRKLEPDGHSLDDLWYGDGNNGNAALTIFRNFDNVMVTRGLVGADPKTLWVMDYPMLERTYYLLVVNFNIFGSAASQLETRLYFDLIRFNGESNFLQFMPPAVRPVLRDSWYQGSHAETKISKSYDVVNDDMPVQIDYQGGDPKSEFVSLVAGRLKSLSGFPDAINRCENAPCYSEGADAVQQRIEANLQDLTSRPAASPGMKFVDFMPDVAFLRISAIESADDAVYTLIRNKAHTNVAFMFDEKKRREVGMDTMTIFPGLLGSYPNFMFNVPFDQLDDFTAALHSVSGFEEFTRVMNSYGLPRMHPEIWDNFQWFVDYMKRSHSLEAGVYDISRYKKVTDLAAYE